MQHLCFIPEMIIWVHCTVNTQRVTPACRMADHVGTHKSLANYKVVLKASRDMVALVPLAECPSTLMSDKYWKELDRSFVSHILRPVNKIRCIKSIFYLPIYKYQSFTLSPYIKLRCYLLLLLHSSRFEQIRSRLQSCLNLLLRRKYGKLGR